MQSATVPSLRPKRTGMPWESTVKCSLLFGPFCSAPFCTSDGLIPSPDSSPVEMNLDIATVGHQPFKIGVVDDCIQQLSPEPQSRQRQKRR